MIRHCLNTIFQAASSALINFGKKIETKIDDNQTIVNSPICEGDIAGQAALKETPQESNRTWKHMKSNIS